MNDKFGDFYKNLCDTIRKHLDNGVSCEEIIGGLESCKLHMTFVLSEEHKRRAVIASWEATKKQFEPKTPDLPMVETTEDN